MLFAIVRSPDLPSYRRFTFKPQAPYPSGCRTPLECVLNMAFSVRSRLWTGLAAGILAFAAPVAATAGTAQAASVPGPNTPEKVATSLLASALPGASAFGTTPAGTPERVSFILRERDRAGLESAVTSGLSSFDSVDQFAAKYGQSQDVVLALTQYLAAFGIKTAVYPGNVDVSASGTAGEFDAALHCIQQNYHVPSQSGYDGHSIPAQTVYSATGAPELPYGFGRDVLAVLGLSNYAPFVSHFSKVSSEITAKPLSSSALGTPGDYLPSAFAASYHLSGLAKQADGAGETLGIVTLATVDPGAPQYFWTKVAKIPATGRTVTVDNVDGGAGKPSDASGTGETDLDVEQSGALAPGANVLVYQAPNSDPGFADAFFSAAGSDTAATLSTSWAQSETFVAAAVAAGHETATYEAAIDEALLELADQGQSVFDAAGDSGAYAASADLGSTNLSVATPSDSPYATAAGGTTLPLTYKLTGPKASVTLKVTKQRSWGWDYAWKSIAAATGTSYATAAISNAAGGGGGFSVVEPEPSYQTLVPGTANYHAVKNLTPTGDKSVVTGADFVEPTSWSVSAAPPLVSGRGSGRAVPDLSADADPFSGYLVYEPSASPALYGGAGGTSFVAPQFNGSAAVIDSYLGHRTGLWNPRLYALAAGPGSPVTPLSTEGSGNDNLYYTGNPGQRYNAASGLGVPNLTKFAADLAAG
jgi:kumamolisin